MKKLFLVLFAAVLVMAFSMPAVAADVKFFGDYYAAGYYSSNYSLNDTDTVNNAGRGTFGNRLRINTVFQVAEGLKLTTRFDALERVWGQEAAIGTPNPSTTSATSGGYRDENNIAWERAYVTFNLGPGFFDVGYAAEGYWSPIAFGNTTGSAGLIRYTAPFGPMTLSAYWEKVKEQEFEPTIYNNGDYDRYALQGWYKWKSGLAGLQLLMDKVETNATAFTFRNTTNAISIPAGYKVTYYEVSPFIQAKFGSFDLEGKMYWTWGEAEAKLGGDDIDIEGLSAYINGKFNFGPAYVGLMFAYIKGDDPNDEDATVSHGGGQDWDPCLILGNDRYAKWQGGRYSSPPGWGSPAGASPFGAGGAGTYDEKNAFFYQVYVGYNPIPKLALKAAFTYMKADETLAGYDDHIGNELDITAAYKIYPNLEYMVGFGYLWTGDWFKGTTSQSVDDNYLLMHQLTLTF